MRRSWIRGEKRGRLVPGAVDALAHSVAGLVAAGYEDHPVNGAFGGTGGGAGNERTSPVLFCEWNDIFRGDSCGRGGCWRVHGGGDIGFGFLEPRVERCAVITERFLGLREAERWKEEKGS